MIFQVGADQIIVPRAVYDQLPSVKDNPQVQRNISKVFEVIESDDAIENFGLTSRPDDPEPLVQIPRAIFPQLSSNIAFTEGDPRRRERTESARLVILKAWLTPGNRKWAFEWNGVPLSAPIKDQIFWEKLDRRVYLIGQGDALDVKLKYQQVYDDTLGIYVRSSYF